MGKKYYFPIRFKILIAVLVVLTGVVGLITFNMAKLFHTDKKAYIHDLTSLMALHTAAEARTILSGHRDRIQVFANLMYNQDLSPDQKRGLLKGLFEDFRDFVAVTIYEGGKEKVTAYDSRKLKKAGLSKKEFSRHRINYPLPFKEIQSGKLFVENSTISSDLPSLTIAVSLEQKGRRKGAVASAVLRLESLQRLARRSKIFETFLIDGSGVYLANINPKLVTIKKTAEWLPQIKGTLKEQTLGITQEYIHNGEEMVGGFAPLEIGNLIIGVHVPKSSAYLVERELLNNMIGIALVLLSGAALLSLIWSRRMTRPIEELSNASDVVGKGEFDVQVQIGSRDEIGMLAGSFNKMASELKTREELLTEAQTQLIQSEKLAAFGQLGAGIAHEVKNPLAGILGYTQLSLRKMNKEGVLYDNLQIIEKETKRCRTIIDNLLRFARQEKVTFEPVDINRVVNDAIAIVDHQMGMHQIKLDKECANSLARIMGNANQIQQVLMNIMINAQQAMEGSPGSIMISANQRGDEEIEIRISDTGPGIKEEVREKLFEPFFTTKSAGKGTGLGLSVSYGIIKDHRGEINVESEIGVGTTFIITLPVIGSGKAPPAHYKELEQSEKSDKGKEWDERN